MTSASVSVANSCKSSNKKNYDHKVVFIGDSHARGCEMRVKESLNENFEVSGFVKPNASTDALTIMTKTEIGNLTDRDVLIFWVDLMM
jgi:hypothetical protein